MTDVQEQFSAVPLAANATRNLTPAAGGSTKLGGILCTAPGNMRIGQNTDGSGADIVASMPIVAGTFYPLPFTFATPCALVLSGGAAGTLAVL